MGAGADCRPYLPSPILPPTLRYAHSERPDYLLHHEVAQMLEAQLTVASALGLGAGIDWRRLAVPACGLAQAAADALLQSLPGPLRHARRVPLEAFLSWCVVGRGCHTNGVY